MADVILQNVVNSIQVKDESGQISPNEYPLGALASNIAVGDESSIVSVQQKIDEYDEFIENLSTTNIKHEEGILSEYLEKNITTDNKSTGIIEVETNDDTSFVTPKNVIDYLQAKTNSEIKSTNESADNNLVTDNAVFKYVNNSILNTEEKIPSAATSLDISENAKYVTVELFNNKYHAMFDSNLTDETNDTTTLVNPNQVVTYIKSKTETGAIEENSTKLVTSGTLYTKFLDVPTLLTTSIISSGHDISDKIYVNPAQVRNYVTSEIATKIPTVATSLDDNSQEGGYYTTPPLVASYVLSKYVGTISEIEEEIIMGEDIDIVTKRVVTLTDLKDLSEDNELYTKGFVTPKQVVDYVALQSHNVDTALREYIGITGTVAETGKLLPEMGEGVTILSRLAALEAAVQINTTATN